MSNKGKIIVIGGGLAGLGAAMTAAEAGGKVDIFSLVPVKRSHSCCAQGGINGAVNTKGEGDSTWEHFDDTVYGGDFLANQPLVKEMCDQAPAIIYMLDRMGVPFTRTSEGLLDFRRFGGTKHCRTAFAGATTGQQLLYALDEQCRKYEAEGKIKKYEHFDFLRLVLDDEGVCRGIIAQDLINMKIDYYPADAVILATGGIGMIFGAGTNSVICTGAAQCSVYEQGAIYANGEFVQVHPTAIPGEDKLRLMSESARGEGGRVWTYKDGKPWYFLEERYPSYGNLVPRDIATREIYNVVYDMKLGVDGKPVVYLDVSHIDAKTLDRKLGGILEIYEKFVGDDPRKVPMKIFPGMHYTMGGVWVDNNHMSNIKGFMAAGECEYQYHGANRLGANALLSCIFAGMKSGKQANIYIKGMKKSCDDISSKIYEDTRKKEIDWENHLISVQGNENVYNLHKELGESMTANCTVRKYNKDLEVTDKKILELQDRIKKVPIVDSSKLSNQYLHFTKHMHKMLNLAKVIIRCSILRNESRGAHYKPDFPERNDKDFLKTTIAKYNPTIDGPDISYEAVDISLIKPRERRYDVDKASS